MKLHTTNLSPFGQRVKLALSFKGLLVETTLIDTFGGTDALGALAPMRQIPILETSAGALPESQVIVDYLEDAHPAPSLLPDTIEGRAAARLIARIADLYIAPHFLTLIIGMRAPPRPEDMSDALNKLARGLSFAEAYLAPSGTYAVGDTLTIGDIALAPFLFLVAHLGDWHGQTAFADVPGCARYLSAIANDRHMTRAFAEMESAYKARIDMLKS